eukprot:2778197-Pleurochrysis_carterae.AAC.2
MEASLCSACSLFAKARFMSTALTACLVLVYAYFSVVASFLNLTYGTSSPSLPCRVECNIAWLDLASVAFRGLRSFGSCAWSTLTFAGACDAIVHDHVTNFLCTCVDPIRLLSVLANWARSQ